MEKGNNIWMPVAIVIAGIAVAGAIIFTNDKDGSIAPQDNQNNVPEPAEFQPVTEADHIRGDINAPFKIVEFSDVECPFCKVFHGTMKTLVQEYDGQIVWAYRHFPIDRHPKAFDQAYASECVAELAGEEVFWQYLDAMYEETPSNNKFNLARLPELAEELGVDRGQFEECLTSGRYVEKINNHIGQAVATGARGTPHTLLITPDNEVIPIPGAQPIENMRELFDQIIAERVEE